MFYAKDIAKPQANETIKNRKFFIDKTASEINIIYPQAKDYIGNVYSMVFSVLDAYPGDTVNYTINEEEYSVVHSDTITVSATSLEGQNTYSISAPDKAGNPSDAEVNFNVIPDAVEKKTLGDYFKVYPNPVSNIGNYEFYLAKPSELRMNIYDIAGRQLEQRVIGGNPGKNKISYDFSKYKPGIYFYRLTTPTRTETKKIIKK